MDDSKLVEGYFHKRAVGFDAIYSGRKGRIARWLNARFRRDMYERFELTFRVCSDLVGCSVLDVGCGSGRYAIEFANRGAWRVVGIDMAANMIELAQNLAKSNKLESVCEFVQADFMDLELDEIFDYSIAIGVLDYVQDAAALLNKMRRLTKRRVAVTFPTKSFLRQQVREIRYRLRNCPLYFYNQRDIERLMETVGAPDYEITKIKGWGYDYFVSISPY